MRHDPTLEQIAELMDELEAYHHRTVVIKIGGNSIADDEHFLAKIGRQIKFLRQNGVRVILIHGGGPQIDDALRAKKIKTVKGPDGRRITSPEAMRVVQKVMNEVNKEVVAALVEAGNKKERIASGYRLPQYIVHAKPLDKKDQGKHNRSGAPSSVRHQELQRLLDQSKIVVLHSLGVGADGKTVYNINGDDYAMAVAIAVKAKRLILVTNVPGVLDKKQQRITAIDQAAAAQLMAEGVITGGMVPKVESALWMIKQGVGGVVIIDGFPPWSILAELLTHQGFGTLFQSRLG